MLQRKTAVFAKLETTYGQDAFTTPSTDTSDLIEVFDLSITPNVDTVERKPYRPSMSPVASIPAKKYMEVNFYVEVKGDGVDPSTGYIMEPRLVRLFEACGFSKTITDTSVSVTGEAVGTGDGTTTEFYLDNCPVVDGTCKVYDNGVEVDASNYTLDLPTGKITFNTAPANSDAITSDYDYTKREVVLKPTSEDFKSLTFYIYQDGELYIVTGARGNVVTTLEANNIGKFTFKFSGQFHLPQDVPFPSFIGCLDSLTPPLIKNIHLMMGYRDDNGQEWYPIISSFEVDMNNDITQRDDANAEQGVGDIAIIGRNPQGKANPDAVLRSEYDIWRRFENGETVQIKGEVGSQKGNRVKVYIPEAVYSTLAFGERDGVVTNDITFTCQGCDDEYQITFS